MKILTLILLLFSISSFAADADHEKTYTQLGCEQDTDLATAQALPNLPGDATRVLMNAEGAPFRWQDRGTPTASVGIRQEAGTNFFYSGAPLSNLKVIEESTSTVLNVCYYK